MKSFWLIGLVMMGIVSSLRPTLMTEGRGGVFVGARSVLWGQSIPLLRREAAKSFVMGNPQMHVSISLKMRNEKALDILLAEQNDPHSSWYHQYLSPGDFTRRFGGDQETVKKIAAYAQGQGLQMEGVTPNRMLVQLSGKLQDVERAFGTRMAEYQVGNRLVYAPSIPPSLPTQLAGKIVRINGLDTVAHYQTFHSAPGAGTGKDGEVRKGFTPQQLRAAYGIEPLIKDGENGIGQKVAFMELDGFNPKDIAAYYTAYQLGVPKYRTILLDGATNVAGTNAVEVQLDMEVTGAIAPGAEQLLYMGQNTLQGLNTLYSRIVNDNLAKVVSTSWGTCETEVDAAEQQVLSSIFKQGAAQGQAFFAAAGDFGAYDCQNYALAVDSPADNPYVVGVGGASLETKDNTGIYKHEKAWACPVCTDGGPYGTGGGGGISQAFARPAYQSGVGLFGLKREVPDVSANADPRTGYSSYCSVQLSGCPQTGWVSLGGTSASAPLWSALAVEINQYLTKWHKPTLGNALASLYGLYTAPKLPYPAFHDIADGNNLYYSAGVGYDLATGLGSPQGWNMARDLFQYPPIAVSPKRIAGSSK